MCLYDLSLVSESLVHFPLSEVLGFWLGVSIFCGEGFMKVLLLMVVFNLCNVILDIGGC